MRFMVAVVIALFIGLGAAPQSAKEKEALGESRRMKILIAGKMPHARTQILGKFLQPWFAKVDAINLEQLSEKTAAPYDVIIADWERRSAHGGFQDHKKPKLKLPPNFSKPIIMIGMVGVEIQRETKIGWGSMDLQNEAHALNKDHPIFKGPLEPKMEFTLIDTPPAYKETVDGKDLPGQLETWKIQNGRVPKDIDHGVTTPPYGFEDSPDAERIASGAGCENPKAIALARHGNYFLWGFSGDPTQMTDAGRKVFINAICWMKKFDGKPPLVKPAMTPRERVWHYIEWLRDADDDDSIKYAKRRFPDDVREKTKTDPDKLEAYYKEVFERMCPVGGESGGFRGDPDLEELGKVSNRKMQFWDAVLARLAKDDKDELALRLAGRYLPDKKRDAAELKAFVQENQKFMFFTDVGGFRWMVDEYAKKEAGK